MHTDPRDAAYRQVIDLAIRRSPWFVLGEKAPVDADKSQYASLMEVLEPYRMKTIRLREDSRDELRQVSNTYRSRAFYSAGAYYLYRCCEESGDLLKQSANRLSDWMYPRLPEDLCFLKQDGGDFLYSVVHEQMYGMDVSEEEAIEFMDQIPGLFLELKAHRELDRLLDDAVKHQADRLSISGHGLTDLPDRIRDLAELRDLEIFEQDLYRLPEALFELSKLERLVIMTADLESIPSSISRLSHLKELRIQCGSSDRPTPGYRVKPKEDIGLNRIPPEIGELQQLEKLAIQYTSIRELPPELLKLEKLRFLDIGKSLIDRKPDFLYEMKQLEYVNVSPNLF